MFNKFFVNKVLKKIDCIYSCYVKARGAITHICLLSFLILTISLLTVSNSFARKIHKNYAMLALDMKTGQVLNQENADLLRYPASTTKLMTLYLAFEALRTGLLEVEQQLYVSKYASSMPKSNLRLKAGDIITTKEAILALIVKSANDVAVVLAEAISGSEEDFAKLMNMRAKDLQMNATNFTNASGLHNKQHYTTTTDLAKLSLAVRYHFSEFFPLFTTASFTYNGKEYYSHNNIVMNFNEATGLKTGYTNKAGYSLITSINKNGYEILGIILGEFSTQARDRKMIQLLEESYKDLVAEHDNTITFLKSLSFLKDRLGRNFIDKNNDQYYVVNAN